MIVVRLISSLYIKSVLAVTLATNQTLVIKSPGRVVGLHNPKADTATNSPATPATDAPAPPAGKRLSLLDAAAMVLAEANEPLNCKTMIEAMTSKGYWQPSQGGMPTVARDAPDSLATAMLPMHIITVAEPRNGVTAGCGRAYCH
jgi:hypothetical protein